MPAKPIVFGDTAERRARRRRIASYVVIPALLDPQIRVVADARAAAYAGSSSTTEVVGPRT